MKSLKKENERFVSEDVVIKYWFVNEKTGAVITAPTDFKLVFFIQDKRKEIDMSYSEVVCERQGNGEPINCKIDADGMIYCYLPQDTFYPGRLILEFYSAVPSSGFANGSWDFVERYDTGVFYKR